MSRLTRRVGLLASSLLLCALAACGGRHGAVQSGPGPAADVPAGLLALLPPLPTGGAASAAKSSSAAQTDYIAGTGIYDESSGLKVSNNSALLPSKPGGVEYGIYELTVGTHTISTIEPDITGQQGQAYVAISDYGLGHWRFLGATGAPTSYTLPAGTYTNASGQFFLLVLTWNGASALHNFTLLHYDDGNAQGARISGKLLDENSQPLAGAHIGLMPGNLDTYTEEDGTYSISVPADDTYTLTPDATGYTFMPMTKDVMITGGADSSGNDFSAVSLDIRGTVLVGGQGVPGVRMKLLTDGRTTTTLANGTYVFQGVNAGMDTVEPKLAGYSFNPGTSPVNVVATDVNNVDFTASAGQPTFKITGKVTDAVTSAPLANATVRELPDYIYAQTDAGGNYQFTGLAPDAYTVTAFLSGYKVTNADQPATIINQDATGINFSAQKLYTISGSIKGGGGAFPLNGINVNIMPGNITVQTVADGSYSCGNQLPGSYTLTPSSPLYTFNPTNKVQVLGNADAVVPDFVGTLGAVTYTNAIGLIVGNHCTVCHSPQAFNFEDPDLSTYSLLVSHAGASNGDVQAGTMPPVSPLSAQLKEQFQAWITGGEVQ